VHSKLVCCAVALRSIAQRCRRTSELTSLQFDAAAQRFRAVATTSVRPGRVAAPSSALALLRRVYLPEQYPQSVGANFARYSLWLLVQNSVGSAAYVLSTNALLTSLGVGVGAALPMAATINWVLKDGLGSLGMIVYAAHGGGARFDGDAKVTKWRADLLFNVGVLLELLTPLVPAFFLPLASLANLAKGVGGLAAGASKATLHRSLALRDNLGDVTAKLYSQGITAYLLGMGIGIGTTLLCAASPLAVAAAFGSLTAVHLGASYRALRCLELHTLNAPRLLLLARHWHAAGTIATPAAIAQQESIVHRAARLLLVAPPLASLRRGVAPAPDFWAHRRLAVSTQQRQRVLLFRDDYTDEDVLCAFCRAAAPDADADADDGAGRAFAAALASSKLWSLELDLIRIDNTVVVVER
jgi:hypothetical protein